MAHAMAAVNLVLCIPFSVQSIKFVAPMQITLYQMTIERAMQKILGENHVASFIPQGRLQGETPSFNQPNAASELVLDLRVIGRSLLPCRG